eukprot:TRINITY_DN65012_c0_g1_i1.p1 TRINITY_DN65012_c0_g1~~TRINITY_DN65012_c0_g1_i1.p1  ORF type:complete len:163 (+),score=7.79 TRINITY_DN65012_c0_g1_i1:20-508(+)
MTQLALALLFLAIAPSVWATCEQCTGGTCKGGYEGYCTCPPGKEACEQRGEAYSECYDPKIEVCCPNAFSHGWGRTCPSINSTCCSGYSIPTCTLKKTQFCCSGIYAASCNVGESCCGSDYPVCVGGNSQYKCCTCGGSFSDGFGCHLNNTCSCHPRKCVPP